MPFWTLIIQYAGILKASRMLPSKCGSASDLRMSYIKPHHFQEAKVSESMEATNLGVSSSGLSCSLDVSSVARHALVSGFQFGNSRTIGYFLSVFKN